MYYRETMDFLNKTLKEDDGLKPFICMELAGLIGVGTSIIQGFPNPVTLLLVGNIMAISKLYKTSNKLICSSKFLEEHEEEIIMLKKSYNKYLELVASKMDDIDKKFALELTITLDYLLHSGTFSYKDKYEYLKDIGYGEDTILGSSIIEGHGVCRHEVSFTSDILTNLKIKNFCIGCTEYKGKKTKKIGNHVVLGLVHDGYKFAYDITNHMVGQIDDEIITFFDYYNNPVIEYLITDLYNDSEFSELPNLDINKLKLQVYKNVALVFSKALKPELEKIKYENKELVSDIAVKTLALQNIK